MPRGKEKSPRLQDLRNKTEDLDENFLKGNKYQKVRDMHKSQQIDLNQRQRSVKKYDKSGSKSRQQINYHPLAGEASTSAQSRK